MKKVNKKHDTDGKRKLQKDQTLPKKSELGNTKVQISVRYANNHSRPPVSCIFSASVKSAVGNSVSEEKSEFATWRDEKYSKYLNIYKSECATWRDEK